ncbi:hypothetical protein G9A89_004549 [Geosiphon pyriformis]|nr:hypothetical protein G9A89_004549 [Geosiphon pyriformis]
MSCTTDTEKLGEQIHQSLLEYSTTTITQAIAETLYIVNSDIKHYVTNQFSQIQQPVESNLKEYKYRSNNLTTVQDKSTVNKKPRILSPTTSSYHQTPQSRIVFNSHPKTQLETPCTSGNSHPWGQHSWTKSLEEYELLDKEKQPALAPREHLNTQTPIPLNVTNNTLPINRIMAYQDIAKLEKFSDEEDNAYS